MLASVCWIIGCGLGFVSAEIAAVVGRDGYVAGIDESASMLALAERRLAERSNTELREADAVSLPFDYKSFDAAVSTQVYEYVSDIDAALLELARVLRPGMNTLRIRRYLVCSPRNCARLGFASTPSSRLSCSTR
ncbi:MAG: ubiquinone/menaquinone biosynthesis C-methylase UbiE, partial [Hyphomicrobiaceae bacterium]